MRLVDAGIEQREAQVRADILAAIATETDAYLREDFPALAACWVHAEYVLGLYSFFGGETQILQGWERIGEQLRMGPTAESRALTTRVERRNMEMRVSGDMAWVWFDEQFVSDDPEAKPVQPVHAQRIMERHAGRWKIAFVSSVQQESLDISIPRVVVDGGARVLQVNGAAQRALVDHPHLSISGGRLVAGRRAENMALKRALNWYGDMYRCLPGVSEMRDQVQPGGRLPLIFGDAAAGDLMVLWVTAGASGTVVTFDDARSLDRQINGAAMMFGLSEAQEAVAREVTEGRDLPAIARKRGTSVNSVRTHLRRIYEKTGVNSRTALVRFLLSVRHV